MNEIMFEKLVNVGGNKWFKFIIISFTASMLILIVVMSASDHKIRCYYTFVSSTEYGLAYKVKGDIDWSVDVTTFTSQNPQETLAVAAELKQCAPKE